MCLCSPPAAETAITIDDVVCVINSGRLKEKSFDPYTSVSTLQVPRGWRDGGRGGEGGGSRGQKGSS